jgi:hypothetical protein
MDDICEEKTIPPKNYESRNNIRLVLVKKRTLPINVWDILVAEQPSAVKWRIAIGSRSI